MLSKDRGPYPPIILLAFLLLQYALYRWLPVATVLPKPGSYVGTLFIGLGVLVIALPAGAFSRAGTTIKPFKESSALVRGGLYRVTRNPMYVGMLSILIGVALLSGSLSPFVAPVLFVPVLNARVICHEEVMLEERFGEDYRDFKRSVRRWV